MPTDPENESKKRIKLDIQLYYALMFLAIGFAMTIWPEAVTYVPGPCDEDELIDCLISDHWGTPGGIAVSLTIGILIGISALRDRRNRGD